MTFKTTTVTARILDTRETYSEINGTTSLIVEFEDGQQISSVIPEDAEETEEGIPALVEALAEEGYEFLGEPTDAAGDVTLIHTTA